MISELNARQRFLVEYRHIRHAEGRGSDDASYYRALPFRDLSGRNEAMWAMRAKTYGFFVRRILVPIEAETRRPLQILDLGSGNCWMSYRLSARGHSVTALDIFRDEKDGLLAARHYDPSFQQVEAEFDRLPFRSRHFDLIIYNSSFHYSTNYIATLSEARQHLRPSGRIVILDTPVYRRPEHGEQMMSERYADFSARYGFRSDAIPSVGFLDEQTLRTLAGSLQFEWTIHRPWYGWRWHLRPLKARLSGRRPPSRFWVLVGKLRN
jgi:SAM-dependent methyltransferase